jgi:hypothetical protein
MNDPVIIELDRFLRESGGLRKLSPVLTPMLRALGDSASLPQTWAPLPDNFFGVPLPGGIVSCWAFALRGRGKFTNERHPNSWQRSIGIQGTALFEVYEQGRWQPRPVDGSGAELEARAVSIPPNVWHRIRIGPETFVSLSFHTAPAAELIEETCVGDNFANTRRRLYHG